MALLGGHVAGRHRYLFGAQLAHAIAISQRAALVASPAAERAGVEQGAGVPLACCELGHGAAHVNRARAPGGLLEADVAGVPIAELAVAALAPAAEHAVVHDAGMPASKRERTRRAHGPGIAGLAGWRRSVCRRRWARRHRWMLRHRFYCGCPMSAGSRRARREHPARRQIRESFISLCVSLSDSLPQPWRGWISRSCRRTMDGSRRRQRADQEVSGLRLTRSR